MESRSMKIFNLLKLKTNNNSNDEESQHIITGKFKACGWLNVFLVTFLLITYLFLFLGEEKQHKSNLNSSISSSCSEYSKSSFFEGIFIDIYFPLF